MNRINKTMMRAWVGMGTKYLPFADAATPELPLGRLMRLSLFQVSVGMASVLLTGTLNRVMIVELGVAAWLVSVMVALPLVFAPFRALIGFKSDTHRSVLGWKRVPYIWMGTLIQFGGLAIMPFALLVLSGEGNAANAPAWLGHAGAGLAFLLVGAGLHTTQTAGLALATDLATPESRPRVVALLYVMLLAGMVISSLVFGEILSVFSNVKLIQVIQGAAVITMGLNVLSLWKQEVRDPTRTRPDRPTPAFRESWRAFVRGGNASRLLIAVGLGGAAFSMQDVLLEPYGGQILKMGVGATTSLTAMMAGGGLIAFTLASRYLFHGGSPYRLATYGAITGVIGFASVIFSDPFALNSILLFRLATGMIGFSGGLFSVGTLTAAMELETNGNNGLALGAWGAVQASAAGIGVASGGAIRDLVSVLAAQGTLGHALTGPSVGYALVYHIEIGLLFATLFVIAPLARSGQENRGQSATQFGLADFPG